MQADVVKSERGVEIAENTAKASIEKSKGEKESAILTASGNAEAVKLNAGAKAEATKLNAAADSEQIEKVGMAQAKVILEQGKSKAAAYKLEVEAMGQENFGKIKVIEQIAAHNIKLIPDNIIMGGGAEGGSLLNSFLGIAALEKVTGQKFTELKNTVKEKDTPSN